MQYIKCQECIYNGTACRYKMANFMSILWNLENFFNTVPAGRADSPYKCKIKINFECTSFSPKIKPEESNV